MNRSKKWLQFTLIGMLGLIFFPQSVHAYLDPGTGSYLVQIILASIAAALLTFKMFWTKIKSLFSKTSPSPDLDPKRKIDDFATPEHKDRQVND